MHAEMVKGCIWLFYTPSALLIFHVFLCCAFSILAKYVIPHFDQFEKLCRKGQQRMFKWTNVEINDLSPNSDFLVPNKCY